MKKVEYIMGHGPKINIFYLRKHFPVTFSRYYDLVKSKGKEKAEKILKGAIFLLKRFGI